MPGNKETVSITIGGETWDLQPAMGLRGMIVVPKVISLLSEMIYGAAKANINLRTLITDEGIDFTQVKPENLLAFKYIADILAESWEDISMHILPVLMNKDAKYLLSNGTWIEHLRALNAVLNFHAPYLLGDDTWSGLKKSFAEVEEETEADTMMDLDESAT